MEVQNFIKKLKLSFSNANSEIAVLVVYNAAT